MILRLFFILCVLFFMIWVLLPLLFLIFRRLWIFLSLLLFSVFFLIRRMSSGVFRMRGLLISFLRGIFACSGLRRLSQASRLLWMCLGAGVIVWLFSARIIRVL